MRCTAAIFLTGVETADGLMFNPDDSITRAEISTIVWRLGNSNVIS